MKERRESLVAHLRDRGIGSLAPSAAVATESFSAEALLIALREESDPRLQLALIPLLIRHPQLANCVAALVNQLEPKLVIELQTLYMAAVYLQRLWKTRLSSYLGTTTLLPDLFSQQMGLPASDVRFGKEGLYDLADAWQARSRYPFEQLAALHTTMELFFDQLDLEQNEPEPIAN